MNLLRAIGLLLLAALASAGADTLPVLSRDTVVARVLARNPEPRAAELRAQGREAAARGASAWMAPEIGVGGSELPYPGMAGGMAPGDPALMLSARQMIPGPGKRESRRRYRASQAEAERAGGAWARARLAAEAKSQYARMATTARKLAALDEAESVMALMLEVAEVRLRLRRGDLATVFAARARLEEMKSMRAMEEAMGRQAAEALALLMAVSGGPAFAADTALRLGALPAEGAADGVPAAEPDRRADLVRMEAEIGSMELGLAAMRTEGRPDFGIQVDHMDMLGMGRRFSMMAMMTLPASPWSRGMVRADAAAMEKDIAAMRAERDAMGLMARRMAAEMAAMLRSEAEQHARYDTSIGPAHRKSLDAALAAYQEGAGDLFRVLDAWDRWVASRMQSLDHLRKALVLEAEYAREAGTR